MSIVYFHGMGTPRRYEELSRLVDTLDQYAQLQDYHDVGRLRGQTIEQEPSRIEREDDVTFVTLSHVNKDFNGEKRTLGRFRIYESFWSPSAAGGHPPLKVALWLFNQLGAPWRVATSRWREHQPLKLTYLHRLEAESAGKILPARFRELEETYLTFENWNSRRKYPKGSFAEFCSLINEKFDPSLFRGNPTHVRKELVAAAKMWQSEFSKHQLNVIGVSVTAFSAIIGLALCGSFFLAKIAILIENSDLSIQSVLSDNRALATGLVTATVGGILFPMRTFLSRFLADVMFWTTSDEKDPRHLTKREILKSGEETLRHVLRDPNCSRVVIVAHSLGTSVAYETLIKMGREKTARKEFHNHFIHLSELDKISDFVTLGSPIDRISYFFELKQSRYHRYNRISHELRGSTDLPPFSRARGLHNTRWLNLWDSSDPVSSRLFSPSGRFQFGYKIENVEIASDFSPSPSASHTGYFMSEEGARHLFWRCIMGRPAPTNNAGLLSGGYANLRLTMANAAKAMLVPMSYGLLMLGVGAWTGSSMTMVAFAAVLAASGALVSLVMSGALISLRWPLDVERRIRARVDSGSFIYED